ncbi:MAG: aminotransferase class I/II-fold pyridoxal phosphate-dependent enzyme [Peptococcaceae bacterium]
MNLDQNEAPLYAALTQYSVKNYAYLHLPAHRQGKTLTELLSPGGKSLLHLDLTELPGLDDLYYPQEAIAEAQGLAAALYKADQSFFLVNGTSGGIQALILSLCRPGDELLLPRNCHRAVLGGLILCGTKPVYLPPVINQEFGFAAGIAPEELTRALKKHVDCRGLLLIHPTYYGVTGDLARLTALTHQENKPVLVDEAHGAHFPFHPALPPDALSGGADAVVQSMHKLGGSLTQSSLLHLKGRRLTTNRLSDSLRLLQTSSPSYLLLASLDVARRQMALNGRKLLSQALEIAFKTRDELSKIPGLKIFGAKNLDYQGACFFDPTRIVISVKQWGLTGYQAAQLLSSAYRVQVEMADYYNLVAIISLGSTREDAQALVKGLSEIWQKEAKINQPLPDISLFPPPVPVRLAPREAWFAPNRLVSLKESAGLVSAQEINLSPPGIPLLFPGEEITIEMCDYLGQLKKINIPVKGFTGPYKDKLRVIKS